MRPEKRKELEAISLRQLRCDLTDIPVTVPGKAKYKRGRDEKKIGPDIEVGKKAVLAVQKGMDRSGYYLGVLVDWYEKEIGYWDWNTTLYFVVLKTSTSKIPDRTGRLVSARWPQRFYLRGLAVISWDEKDFPVDREKE